MTDFDSLLEQERQYLHRKIDEWRIRQWIFDMVLTTGMLFFYPKDYYPKK